MSLWGSVVQLYATFSPLLEQIQSSSFYQQHSQRLVDNYAASTLIKYLMALQTFYQLAVDMRLDLSNLSELQLADILVAGKLSKHSTDAGASHSMLIKAIRWGFKQLQLDCFSVAFGPLISSFQSKIPHDRKESLPFSLYIMSQFERHILVRETPMAEILVLGAFLDVTLLKKMKALFLQTKICEVSQIRINKNHPCLVVNKCLLMVETSNQTL